MIVGIFFEFDCMIGRTFGLHYLFWMLAAVVLFCGGSLRVWVKRDD